MTEAAWTNPATGAPWVFVVDGNHNVEFKQYTTTGDPTGKKEKGSG